MKRSNHKQKKGSKPVVATCHYCGHEAHSKYEAKTHLCAGSRRSQ